MQLNYLSDMNLKQVRELQEKTNIAILPIGPTEVHGPHLPFGTDVISANEMAKRAAEKLLAEGIDTLIAPSVNYCLADLAHCFEGNITLRSETVSNLVEDICLSLAKWNFNKIMIVCGHGEPRNIEAIAEGAKKASQEMPELSFKVSEWLIKGMEKAAPFMKGEHPMWDLHAGEVEASLMAFARPELLDHEELMQLEPNWAGEHLFANIAAGKSSFYEVGAPLAYLGDPRIATKETGDKVYDVFSDIIVEEMHEMIK